jgi:hypothetical protein
LILLSKIRRRFISTSVSHHIGQIQQPKLVFTGYETDRLRNLLGRYEGQWRVMKPLLLWTAVLAALEVGDENEREWFEGLIARTAEELGLTAWGEVEVVVSNLLWVGEVLNGECEALGKNIGMAS